MMEKEMANAGEPGPRPAEFLLVAEFRQYVFIVGEVGRLAMDRLRGSSGRLVRCNTRHIELVKWFLQTFNASAPQART